MTKVFPGNKFYHPNQIGRKAEELAEKALKELKTENKIQDFWRNNFNGVDFIVNTLSGKKLSIQVKSCIKGAMLHMEKHPDIPVIRIPCWLNMRNKAIRRTVGHAKTNVLEIIKEKEGKIL